MTDAAKSTPGTSKATTTKSAAKDDATKNVKTTDEFKDEQSGKRDDVADGQQVQEREDIGAAAGEGKPETVKVITEVRPGVAN